MRIALPWCRRSRFELHSSAAFVCVPVRCSSITFAPALYSAEMKSRLPGPHTGVAIAIE